MKIDKLSIAVLVFVLGFIAYGIYLAVDGEFRTEGICLAIFAAIIGGLLLYKLKNKRIGQ